MRAPLLPRHSHTFQKYRHYPDFLPAPAAPPTSPAPCRSGLKAALPRCPRPASASRLPWRGRAPLTAVGWDHSPGKGPTTLPLVDHINDDSGWPLTPTAVSRWPLSSARWSSAPRIDQHTFDREILISDTACGRSAVAQAPPSRMDSATSDESCDRSHRTAQAEHTARSLCGESMLPRTWAG